MTVSKPFAITLGAHTSLANHTGSWRTERPQYVERTPPCSGACPAGEPVREWLSAAEEGGYEAAWRRIVVENPFPAVMGRVCYHPCETACNRGELDSAVGINSVERFLGDEAIRQAWRLPDAGRSTGKRVLVVGAGPAGLSAAYQLRRAGHSVVVRDGAAQAGGMMRAGIPTFRLPRDVLDIEIARLEDVGVVFELGRRVDDVLADKRDGAFDAVFLAIGAQLAHRAYVPAAHAARLLDALELLGAAADGERPSLGHRVVVYGGGNTAMDAARTARRLGAEDALIVYRRTRAVMPANAVELDEAEAEGVRFRWLSTIREVDGRGVTVERMELGADGRPTPTGETEVLTADAVVLAIGQDVDRTALDRVPGLAVDDGVVAVDAAMRTGHEGVFAGGDMVAGPRSVTAAIGHGKAAARHIDAWLRKLPEPQPGDGSARQAVFTDLNTWYYTDAPHAVRPRLEAARRVSDFTEVVGGLDAGTALYEARRCLSCGSCFSCDNCYGVCPDNAVRKTADGYEIDYDFCKGCGLCVAECPCGAIELVPEPD